MGIMKNVMKVFKNLFQITKSLKITLFDPIIALLGLDPLFFGG